MPTTEVQRRHFHEEEHRAKLAEITSLLLHGAHNEVHEVTMTNGTTTTRFPAGTDLNLRITPSTIPVLIPLTFNATITPAGIHFIPYPSTRGIGYIVFTHLSTANTDQTFALLLFGD